MTDPINPSSLPSQPLQQAEAAIAPMPQLEPPVQAAALSSVSQVFYDDDLLQHILSFIAVNSFDILRYAPTCTTWKRNVEVVEKWQTLHKIRNIQMVYQKFQQDSEEVEFCQQVHHMKAILAEVEGATPEVHCSLAEKALLQRKIFCVQASLTHEESLQYLEEIEKREIAPFGPRAFGPSIATNFQVFTNDTSQRIDHLFPEFSNNDALITDNDTPVQG